MSVGSNKALVVAVIGTLALIAIAILVIAGLVLCRKKATKKCEKLPHFIDE